jgi:hypothetical protein
MATKIPLKDLKLARDEKQSTLIIKLRKVYEIAKEPPIGSLLVLEFSGVKGIKFSDKWSDDSISNTIEALRIIEPDKVELELDDESRCEFSFENRSGYVEQ